MKTYVFNNMYTIFRHNNIRARNVAQFLTTKSFLGYLGQHLLDASPKDSDIELEVQYLLYGRRIAVIETGIKKSQCSSAKLIF